MALNKLEKTILTAGLVVGLGIMPSAALYQDSMMTRASKADNLEEYETHARKTYIYGNMAVGISSIVLMGYLSCLNNNSKKEE